MTKDENFVITVFCFVFSSLKIHTSYYFLHGKKVYILKYDHCCYVHHGKLTSHHLRQIYQLQIQNNSSSVSYEGMATGLKVLFYQFRKILEQVCDLIFTYFTIRNILTL